MRAGLQLDPALQLVGVAHVAHEGAQHASSTSSAGQQRDQQRAGRASSTLLEQRSQTEHHGDDVAGHRRQEFAQVAAAQRRRAGVAGVRRPPQQQRREQPPAPSRQHAAPMPIASTTTTPWQQRPARRDRWPALRPTRPRQARCPAPACRPTPRKLWPAVARGENGVASSCTRRAHVACRVMAQDRARYAASVP